MADRVVAMSEDGTHAHYLWDSGWVVSFNKFTRSWTRQRIAHPADDQFLAAPNREAAPEVADD